jgi:hypothetical protein
MNIVLSLHLSIYHSKEIFNAANWQIRGQESSETGLDGDNCPGDNKQTKTPEDEFQDAEPRLAAAGILFTNNEVFGDFAALEYIAHVASLRITMTITTNKPGIGRAGLWRTGGNLAQRLRERCRTEKTQANCGFDVLRDTLC